jgi:hypothetical protein
MKNSILIQTSEFFFFLQRNEGQYFTKNGIFRQFWEEIPYAAMRDFEDWD